MTNKLYHKLRVLYRICPMAYICLLSVHAVDWTLWIAIQMSTCSDMLVTFACQVRANPGSCQLRLG